MDGLRGRFAQQLFCSHGGPCEPRSDGWRSWREFFRLTKRDGAYEWNIGRAFIWTAASRRELTMKVVYNWLKDFVDVTAPPQELASRLALSGTNIGGVENGPHGAVIDAEVSSNRPDCLAHYVSPAKSARFTSCL